MRLVEAPERAFRRLSGYSKVFADLAPWPPVQPYSSKSRVQMDVRAARRGRKPRMHPYYCAFVFRIRWATAMRS